MYDTMIYHDKLRNEVLDKLGGKCVKCGFADRRALQIDHVNGNGLADRKLYTNGGSSWSFLKAVLRDKEGKYQLLCANCNWIKKSENKERTGKPSLVSRMDSIIRAGIVKTNEQG